MRGCFPRKAKDYGDTEPQLAAGIRTGLVGYTLQQLEIATNDFSSDNKIGEGRFGSVFRGEIDYRAVTVKRLDARYHRIADTLFIKEINALSRIHHRNITSLIGFCISKDERLLVFDFAENNSLEYHLHDSEKDEVLDWRTRRKIALGTARALAYLHHDCEPRIIHGDIKPANILLNSEFEAKVSGYDNAKLYPDSENTARILGTDGYVDPQYVLWRSLTSKTDVYSFGMMILEMITGLEPNSGEDLKVPWLFHRLKVRTKVLTALKENIFEDIVDPRLPRDYDPKEITCMVACALVSTFYSPTDRPTMKQIINVLEGQQTPDSFIRQVLEIEEKFPSSYPAPPFLFRASPSPHEDTDDMESLPLSSDINPPASSSYIHPLPSSSKGDLVEVVVLVATGEDIKSLPLSSDMNPPASSSSYIYPLPSSSEGDLVATGEDIKSLPSSSSDMNPPASSSYINLLPSSSEGDLVAISEDMKSLFLSSYMSPPASSSSSSYIYPLTSSTEGDLVE